MTAPASHAILNLFQIAMYLLLEQTILMTAGWLLSWPMRNDGLVDVMWPAGMLLATVHSLTMAPVQHAQLWVLATAYLICCGRFLVGWCLRHSWGRREDGRWQLWRSSWQQGQRLFLPFGWRSYAGNKWLFYAYQGWANSLFLTVPLPLVACHANGTRWNGGHVCAVLCFLVGFVVENVADVQLADFKRKQSQRMQRDPNTQAVTRGVCRQGLWAWSRHPNYFGEWLIWWSYAFYTLASCWDQFQWSFLHTSHTLSIQGGVCSVWVTGWQVLAVPLCAYVFLRHWTGVDITEANSCRRRPAYRDYQLQVPTMIPWPPRKL